MKKETKSTATLESLTKTIEKLAVSTARGFEEAEKESKKRFETLNLKFQDVFEELGNVRASVRDIRETLGPLTRSIKSQDEELTNLHLRVGTIERKLGIERKKALL